MSSPTPAQSPAESSAPSKRKRGWLDALYPAVWRWHFWAGLLVAPILIIVSLTGGIYVFYEEITRAANPGMFNFEPLAGQPRQTLETRIAAARARIGPEWELTYIKEFAEPGRADEFLFEKETGGASADHDDEHNHVHRAVMVNPQTAAVTGVFAFEETFMGTVLKIHRTLMGGKIGRIIVEVATCWGIVSLLSGLLLWWPRLKEKFWGVWLPRFRSGGKLALRDLHTVPGIYVLLFALVIMFTGLLFSSVWGRGFFAALHAAKQLPASYVSAPKSVEPANGAPAIDVDSALAIARRSFDFRDVNIAPPYGPQGSWSISSPGIDPLTPGAMVFVDQYSGVTLDVVVFQDMPFGARLAMWFYPLHVGSIFGMPTKILACLSCLVIILMSITGVLMWWRRRPAGKFGAPRKPTNSTPVPKLIVVVIIFLGILFPLVGATLVFLFIIEGLVRLLRKA